MKKKNILRYISEYKNISNIQLDRIISFISTKKFTNKDISILDDMVCIYRHKKKKKLEIILDIIPEATPRPRLGRNNFYVKNASDNNKYIQLLVSKYSDLKGLVDTACSIKINNYFPIPKSFNKVDVLLCEMGIIRPTGKPDWDNLGKTYSDIIQPWIIKDDALIVDGESHKYYSLKPRVEITIKW